jgi:hypothetical protein
MYLFAASDMKKVPSWFHRSGSLFLPPAVSTLNMEVEFVFETSMDF